MDTNGDKSQEVENCCKITVGELLQRKRLAINLSKVEESLLQSKSITYQDLQKICLLINMFKFRMSLAHNHDKLQHIIQLVDDPVSNYAAVCCLRKLAVCKFSRNELFKESIFILLVDVKNYLPICQQVLNPLCLICEKGDLSKQVLNKLEDRSIEHTDALV
ncbi:hypothetical protein GJ496_009415 [Pomphorhynchus laevis]|nr:hypothetical protein GJ496_009415 [Pomphorhynchus laevis]